MDTVTAQLKNTVSNHDIKLNVSTDTSGLQQYTSQLEKLVQLSSQIQFPSVNSVTMQTGAGIPKTDTAFTSNAATDFKKASSEGNNFSNTFSTIATTAGLLTNVINISSTIKNFSKNLD